MPHLPHSTHLEAVLLKNNPPQIKKAFMLMGMADVMTLMGKQLRELALELVKGGEK